MEFKKYDEGKLEFINVKANYIVSKKLQPKFEYEDNHYHSEDYGIKYFQSKGFNAFFAENELWVKLLIYLLHDELKRDSYHKPSLSNINYYLYDDDYFNENKTKFYKRFNYLKTVNLGDEIKNNCPTPDKKVIALCNHLENNQILQILFDMISNLNIKKQGFPDLFVFNGEKSFFCEVKGNSDSLSYVQIKKHEILLNTGISVVIFSINKNNNWIKKQKKKYFNKSLFRRTNFIDNYDSKIYTSQKVYDELIDEGIDDFERNFLLNHDSDSFIGFLNIIEDYSFDEKINSIKFPSQELINDSIKMGDEIKEKRILKNGKILEDKKKYNEAINEYSKVDSFKSYKRIIYCYRALRDYENELNFIYAGINNSKFQKKDKRFFKNRLRRFFKNEDDYSVVKTNMICPYCGEEIVLNNFKTRNNIKFFTCSNNKCYFYGGMFKGNLKDLPNLKYSKEFDKII